MRNIVVEDDMLSLQVGNRARPAAGFYESVDNERCFSIEAVEDAGLQDFCSDPFVRECRHFLVGDISKPQFIEGISPLRLAFILPESLKQNAQVSDVSIGAVGMSGVFSILRVDSIAPP